MSSNSVPVPGDQTPRRGNRLTRAVGTFLLRLVGWRIEGRWPDLPRCVAIAAPHTSNWDFYIGICAIFALGLRVSWIGKASLFRWPYGGFMRWLGGTPVTRVPGEGVVEEVVRALDRQQHWIFGLSPEGTRKRVERWRTGFYHVARRANVPIVLTYFDYSRKTAGVGPVFRPTGDVERDLAEIRSFYEARMARYPDQF